MLTYRYELKQGLGGLAAGIEVLFTTALLIFNYCLTTALLLLYYCFTKRCSFRMRSQRIQIYFCFTNTLLLLYSFLYYCFRMRSQWIRIGIVLE